MVIHLITWYGSKGVPSWYYQQFPCFDHNAHFYGHIYLNTSVMQWSASCSILPLTSAQWVCRVNFVLSNNSPVQRGCVCVCGLPVPWQMPGSQHYFKPRVSARHVSYWKWQREWENGGGRLIGTGITMSGVLLSWVSHWVRTWQPQPTDWPQVELTDKDWKVSWVHGLLVLDCVGWDFRGVFFLQPILFQIKKEKITGIKNVSCHCNFLCTEICLYLISFGLFSLQIRTILACAIITRQFFGIELSDGNGVTYLTSDPHQIHFSCGCRLTPAPHPKTHTHTHTATPLNAQEGKIGSLGQVSAFTSPVFSHQCRIRWTERDKERNLH